MRRRKNKGGKEKRDTPTSKSVKPLSNSSGFHVESNSCRDAAVMWFQGLFLQAPFGLMTHMTRSQQWLLWKQIRSWKGHIAIAQKRPTPAFCHLLLRLKQTRGQMQKGGRRLWFEQGCVRGVSWMLFSSLLCCFREAGRAEESGDAPAVQTSLRSHPMPTA